jgi:hypothetical protein
MKLQEIELEVAQEVEQEVEIDEEWMEEDSIATLLEDLQVLLDALKSRYDVGIFNGAIERALAKIDEVLKEMA